MLHQQFDIELRDAICDVIDDLDPRHRVPRSEVRHLAEFALREGKATDGEWMFGCLQAAKKEMNRKRNIAKLRGYTPFSNLNLRVYKKLKETFGEDVLQLMQDGLRDPEDIYSKWAYRFACAVRDIGFEECVRHKGDLYQFVLGHMVWEENFAAYSESFADWLGLKPQTSEVAEAESDQQVENLTEEDHSSLSSAPQSGLEMDDENSTTISDDYSSGNDVSAGILKAHVADPTVSGSAVQFS